MNLILFGFKNVGKSHFAKRAANTLHYNYLDTDHLIEKLYQSKCGKKLSYREIYRQEGSDTFRKLEKEAIVSIENEKKAIIAVGGGAVCDARNLEILARIGTLVYLFADKKTISKRSANDSATSPLFSGQETLLDTLYDLRKPIYEKIPAHKINTDTYSEEEVVEIIGNIVREHG